MLFPTALLRAIERDGQGYPVRCRTTRRYRAWRCHVCVHGADEWQRRANLTIETIHRILIRLYGDKARKVPPTFVLQLDNTSGQNKNSYVLAYLTFLAQTMFQVVEANFLPVGHTHADIDQMFRVFKGALKKCNALSRQEFLFRLQDAMIQLRLSISLIFRPIGPTG